MIRETINKQVVARLRTAIRAIAISGLLTLVPAYGQYVHQLSKGGGSHWTDQNLNRVPSQTGTSTWAYQDITAQSKGGNPPTEYGGLTGFSLGKAQYLFYVALP